MTPLENNHDRRTPTDVDRLHDSLSELDRSLSEMRELLVAHVAEEKDIAPALRELVSLWRASKLLGVLATAVAGMVASAWATWAWIRDHVKIS